MASFPIKIFRVAERSMEPSIREGSYAIAWTRASNLKPGDVIVLRHPSKEIWIVKRVRSMNGNMLYVVGDNSSESEDSRKFGAVSLERVAGKVIFAV